MADPQTDPIDAAFAAAKATVPDPIEAAFQAAKNNTGPFVGPEQPAEPDTLSAHGITDPDSVRVTELGAVTPKRDLPNPVEGMQQFGRGFYGLGTAFGGQPGHPGETSEALRAGSDLIEGIFQMAAPLVGASAMEAPLGTAWGLLKAYVAGKAGTTAAAALTDNPDAHRFAGDLAAAISGTKSVDDFAQGNIATATKIAAEFAKAKGRALTLAATLARPGSGTGDVPGFRANPAFDESMVDRADREASQARSADLSEQATQAADEARQGQPEQGQRSPQVTPVEQVPTDVQAAYEQAKRVTEMRGGRTAGQLEAVLAGPTTVARQDAEGRLIPPTVAVPAPPPADLQPAVEAAAIGHPYQASTEAIQAEHEAGSASLPRGVSEEKPSYGSTQVQLPPETAKKVTDFAQAIPDDQLAEHGRETDPHVTVKYGLHTDNVDEVRKVLAGVAPITVSLGATSVFPDTGNGDVLKVDVDSPDLHALNAKIAGALETTDTHPTYQPHATIAYLKPGVGAQYAGRKDFAGDTMTVDHVVFSLPNDSKVSIPLTGQQGDVDTLAAYTAAKGVESPHGEAATPPLTDGAHRPAPEGTGAVESGGRDADAARARVHAGEPVERFVRKPAAAHAHRFTPAVTRELTRLEEELSTFPHAPRAWQDLSHEHGLLGNAAGGHAQITGAVAGAEAYEDIRSQSPVHVVTSGRRKGQLAKVAGGTQAKILHAVRRVLATHDITNNLMEGAVKVAELRAAGDYRDIQPPALPPSWGTVSPAVEAALEAAYDAPSDADAWEEALHRLQDEEASGDVDFDPETMEAQGRLPEAGSVREQEHATPQFEAPFSLTGDAERRTAVEPDLFGSERPKFSARTEPAPIFYSALTRAAEALKQNKGTPEQMAAMLEKAPGIKKEELDWSGVLPWIKGQQQFVTKAAIVDYLQKNELQVTETVRGTTPERDTQQRRYDELARQDEHTPDEDAEMHTLGRRLQGTQDTGKFPKYGAHTLPGGSHYRELLIQLPVNKPDFDPSLVRIERHTRSATQGHYALWYGARSLGSGYDLARNGWHDAPGLTTDAEIVDMVRKRYETTGEWNKTPLYGGVGFTSGHFDEPNVLAHVRFNDRQDADGKRILFIEEIQSDWHQQGRKRGYATAVKEIDGHDHAWWQAEMNRLGGENARARIADRAAPHAEAFERARANTLALMASSARVPDAPFKTTWQELAARRMVRYAAEHGYDRLAWTTGEQQNDRYDLSKHVSEVVLIKNHEGREFVTARNLSGQQVLDMTPTDEKPLEDIIGKDVAEKLTAQDWKPSRSGNSWQEKRLAGLDLKVGGQGMIGFYDKILPAYLNKFGKPFGARVGETRIKTAHDFDIQHDRATDRYRVWDTTTHRQLRRGNDETIAFDTHADAAAWLKENYGGTTVSVHAIDITDPMRRTALEGLPLFAEQRENPAFRAWFGDSKVVDKDGNPLVVYHGTKRGDRVGNRFRKTRATSGPMAFFTTDKAIAEKYSTGKEDTSLEHPDDYAGWFTFKPKGSRSTVDLDRAWYFLTPEQRATVLKRLPTVGYQDHDQGTGPIVADSQSIAGKDHIDYLLQREARGNGLKAAKELWLNSGSLFDDEEKFFDVLKGLGLEGLFEWNSPWKTQPHVYAVYLSIQTPLVTSEIPKAVLDALEKRSRRQRVPEERGGSDQWDKRTRNPHDWMTTLREDTATGTNSHAWTSIPDWVTETLKGFGYDGIHDTGGKMGGEAHDVWIPFDDRQVKSATDNRGTYDPTKPDIRFSESDTPRGNTSTDRDLLRQTYRDMRSVPMGDRSVVVFDAGSRFSPDEIAALTQNPAVQRIAEASLDVLDQVLDRVVGKDKTGVERTGLVLMQDIFGVYVPKPGAARGQQQRATILLNPFEAMIGPRQSVVAPSEAAKVAYYTAVHEAMHWHVPFDGPDFDAQLHALLEQLGDEFRDTSTARIMETYADPDQPRKYRAGVLDLLQTYQGTRRRPATARDALSDARGGDARFADRGERESPAPRDLRPSRARTVTEQQLRTLAARAGTSVAKQREEAEKRGYTVYSTVLPGAEKLEPAVEKIAQALRNDTGLLLSLIGPAHVGVAPMAAGSARAYTAARDQQLLRVQKELAAAKRVMDGWSKEKVKLFWRVMEGQEPAQSLPRSDRQYAQTLGAVLKRWTDLIVELGLIEDYLEHYFPHEWVKGSVEGDLLRRLFGRRPMQGSEAFRKRRSIPTMEEGLKIGLEPVSWNPADQVFRKVAEMARSVRARGFRDDMKRQGLYAYVPAGKTKPDTIRDWQRIPDEALGTVYGARVPEQAYGQVIAGHYYAPREVVRLVENMISRGLHGRSVLLDTFNAAGNASTAALLGWSSMHLWLTGLEHTISKWSLGQESLARGEWGSAAKAFAQVGPHGLIRDLVRGYKLVHEFYGRDATANATTGFVGQTIQGGGGFGRSLFEAHDAPQQFMTNLRRLLGAVQSGAPTDAASAAGKALWHGAATLAEGPTLLIMNYWVPYLKAAAFHDLAQMELRRLGDDATLEDQRQVYGKAWDAVDNRFGQLRYDNLFWNNTFKQILMSLFLSVGWQVGSVRAGGGALKQIPLTARKLKAALEGGAGKPPEGPADATPADADRPPAAPQGYVEPWLDRDFSWMVALIAIVVTIDAVKQYLSTGLRLGEDKDGHIDWRLALRDAFAPRNGRIGPSGREERDTPISYAKDFYGWLHHPVTTTEHKLRPLLHTVAEMVENEDFYGDAIYDGTDPLGARLKDLLLYALKSAEPISYENAKRRLAEGAPFSTILKEAVQLQAVPFIPASAELERSDLEQYLHDLIPPSHRSKADAAKAAARRQMREDLRQGDAAAAHQTATEAGLSRRSEQAVRRSERVGSLASAFDRVTWPEAVTAMDLATDTERASLRGPFLRKALNALKATRSSEERARIQQQRNAALKQPQPTM